MVNGVLKLCTKLVRCKLVFVLWIFFVFLFSVFPIYAYDHQSGQFGAYQSQHELISKQFGQYFRLQRPFDSLDIKFTNFDKNKDFPQIDENIVISPWGYTSRFFIVFAGAIPITTLGSTATFLAIPTGWSESQRILVTLGSGLALSATIGLVDLIIHLIIHRKS